MIALRQAVQGRHHGNQHFSCLALHFGRDLELFGVVWRERLRDGVSESGNSRGLHREKPSGGPHARRQGPCGHRRPQTGEDDGPHSDAGAKALNFCGFTRSKDIPLRQNRGRPKLISSVQDRYRGDDGSVWDWEKAGKKEKKTQRGILPFLPWR
eukprot:scaffold1291_cov256-Pinguiococcus_pyrenoidosus.AAC.3